MGPSLQLCLRGKGAHVWGFEVQTWLGRKIMLHEYIAWSTPRIQTELTARSLDPLIWGSQGPQPVLLGVTEQHRQGCICFYSSPFKDLWDFCYNDSLKKNFFLMSQTFTCTFMTCTWPQAALCLLPTFAQMLLWLPKRGPQASDTTNSTFHYKPLSGGWREIRENKNCLGIGPDL